MMYNPKFFGSAALSIALISPAITYANNVTSNGGLKYGSSEDPYWFEIGGIMKLDHRTYTSGKTRTSSSSINSDLGGYHSGAQIRDTGLDLSGGIGKNFSYTFGLSFDAKNSSVGVEEAFITYEGIKFLGENFSISLGQVNPGFCLESSSSSKWTPFMERSMPSTAFAPCPGLGISANKWQNNYSFTVAVTQPQADKSVKNPDNTDWKRSDRWNSSARFTFAPIAEDNKLLQLGVSGHVQDGGNEGIAFSTAPEMRSRNTTSLLNTTSGSTRIASKYQTTLDLELMGLYGPWSGEVEYQVAHVKRGLNTNGAPQGDNLNFNGYHAQVSYVLTGESRSRRKSLGTLGQIKPNSEFGAWEVSARYSFLNLNDKDVYGGAAHNTSCSLSWYANNNIRVLGEYVHSQQRREFNNTAPAYLDKRNTQSLGLRLQVVF